jgi:CRISPR/Cas system-associated endoribonuclease Cas2
MPEHRTWRLTAAVTVVAGARDTDRSRSDDGDMPRVDDAHRIQQFRLDDRFQETFDSWAAEVEKNQNGALVITHEEIIHQGMDMIIFYRIDPKPHIARSRR